MFGKNRNKKVGLCVMVVTSCFILAGIWAVLATPETALAKKPGGGGGKPEALHGTATFRDALGDRVQSDGGGPYTDASIGKKGGATVLGLGDFFRLKVKLNKKNEGRSFNLDFVGLDINPAFFPASPDVWILGVQGTLQEWRAQDLNTGVLRKGNLFFGQTGKDEANVSYGRWGGNYLTVTRTDVDVWTIESLPTDYAFFYRQDLGGFGTGPMPFQVTYEGQ